MQLLFGEGAYRQLVSVGAARSGDEPLEVFALWNDGLSVVPHAEGTAPWMI